MHEGAHTGKSFMIYVKEKLINDETIGRWVDGILDLDSIPVIRDVCTHPLENHKNITMHLDGLLHVTRENKKLLREIQNKVRIVF